MTRRDHTIKWLLYALGVFPIWLAETHILNRLPVFGVIPVLLPLAAVGLALWEGALPGAVFGLCVGMVADAAYPGVPGGMTLGLALMGAVTGAMSQYGVRQTYLGYLLCASSSMAALELIRLAVAIVTRLGEPAALLRVALLEAGWSLCFTPVIYLLFRAIYNRVGGEKLGG